MRAIHQFADYNSSFPQGELIRRRAHLIDREAQNLIQETVQGLEDRFQIKPQMAAELKFTNYTDDRKAQEFKVKLAEYVEGKPDQLEVVHNSDHEIEVDCLKSLPLDLLALMQDLKTFVIKHALVESADKSGLSFVEGTTHPHTHLNCSLRQDSKNIFGGMVQTHKYFVFYLLDRLVEDLQAALMVFTLSKNAYKRFEINFPFAPNYFSWSFGGMSKRTYHKRDGHALLVRERYNPNRARLELRVPESAGIDSLQILFILRSILNSLDELLRKVQPSQPLSGEQLFDHFNEELERRQDLKAPSFYDTKHALPSNMETAFRQFEQSAERMKKIFGDKIYNWLTEAA
jgi:Glutamine synthetase, catalytic domain